MNYRNEEYCDDYYDEDFIEPIQLNGIEDICKRGYFNVPTTVETTVYWGDGTGGCCETEKGTYEIEHAVTFTGNAFEAIDYVHRMNGEINAIELIETPHGLDSVHVDIVVQADINIHWDQIETSSESIYNPNSKKGKKFDLTDVSFKALLQRASNLMNEHYFHSWTSYHLYKTNKTMTTTITGEDVLWFSHLTYDYINCTDDFYTGEVKDTFDRLYATITAGRNFDSDVDDGLFSANPFARYPDCVNRFLNENYPEKKFTAEALLEVEHVDLVDIQPCRMFGKLHHQRTVEGYWEALDLVRRYGGSVQSVKIIDQLVRPKPKKTRKVLEVSVKGFPSSFTYGYRDCVYWSKGQARPKHLMVQGPLLEIIERAKAVCPENYHERIDLHLSLKGQKSTFDERDIHIVRFLMYDRAINPTAYVIKPRAPLPQLYAACTGRNLFIDIQNSRNDLVFCKDGA